MVSRHRMPRLHFRQDLMGMTEAIVDLHETGLCYLMELMRVVSVLVKEDCPAVRHITEPHDICVCYLGTDIELFTKLCQRPISAKLQVRCSTRGCH